MKLVIVPPDWVDFAWRTEGADSLSEVCALVEEITGSQLKMILCRGERTLVKMEEDGKAVGWGAFRVDNLPNIRVLHITDLIAPNQGFETVFDQIKDIAKKLGCAQVRSSAPPAQARLYRTKCGFKPIYETMKVDI